LLERVEIERYRSLRHVTIDLGQITVVTGRNGTGKSNLYNALRLLQAGAQGTFSSTLLAEGGMPSALWAGDRANGPVQMRLAVRLEGLSYELVGGLVPKFTDTTPFVLDPEIKHEYLYLGTVRRPSTTLVDRSGASAALIDDNGERHQLIAALDPAESLLSQVMEPASYSELELVRRNLLGWRFYHHFDTTASAPARQVQAGVRVNTLAPDGHNLAAMVATLAERGDVGPVAEAVAEAFPGYALYLGGAGPGRFSIGLVAPGLNRPLAGSELSDGQLRFLYLAAAVLSSRPPPLLVLNEPETSLHPRAVAALVPLLRRAAKQSQIWITTHSHELATLLGPDTTALTLELDGGATVATTTGHR
jgi:predicted ATPase